MTKVNDLFIIDLNNQIIINKKQQKGDMVKNGKTVTDPVPWRSISLRGMF